MQKTLIGILTVTTLALGSLCVVQSRRLRASDARVRATEEARALEFETHQVRSARLKESEGINEQRGREAQSLTEANPRPGPNKARRSSTVTALTEHMRELQGKSVEDNGTASAEASDGLFGKDMGQMLAKMMKDPRHA